MIHTLKQNRQFAQLWMAVFVLLCITDVSAQMIWKQTYQERTLRNQSNFQQMAIADDQHIFVTGTTEHEFRSQSFFVSCYDSSAALKWAIRDSSVYGDLPGGFIKTTFVFSEQSLFVAGFGSELTADSSATFNKPLLAKIDTAGHILFKTDIPGISGQPYDIKYNNGYIYVLLLTNLEFGLETSIHKFDLDGQLIWSKKYNHINSDEFPIELVFTPESNRLFMAYQSNIAIKLMEFNQQDGALLNQAIPIQGEIPDAIYPANLQMDEQGDIYLGCSVKNGGINSYDYLVVKFDSSLAVDWQLPIGQPYDQQMSRLVYGHQSIYFTGLNSESVIRTYRISKNGNILWQKGYSSVNYPVKVYDLLPGKNQSLYITGLENLDEIRHDAFFIRYDGTGTPVVTKRVIGDAAQDFVFPRLGWNSDSTSLILGGVNRKFIYPELSFYPYIKNLAIAKMDALSLQILQQNSTSGIGIGNVSTRWVKYDGANAIYQAGSRNRGFVDIFNNSFYPVLDFYLSRYDTSGQLIWQISLDSLDEDPYELQPPVAAALDEDGNPMIIICDYPGFYSDNNNTYLYKFSKNGYIDWKTRLNNPNDYTYFFAFKQIKAHSYILLRRDTFLNLVKVDSIGQIIAQTNLVEGFIGCAGSVGSIGALPDQQLLVVFPNGNCSEGYSIARLDEQLQLKWRFSTTDIKSFRAYSDKNLVIVITDKQIIQLRLSDGILLQSRAYLPGNVGLNHLMLLDDRIALFAADTLWHYTIDNLALTYSGQFNYSMFHSNNSLGYWISFDGNFYGRILDVYGHEIGNWHCEECSNQSLTPPFSGQVNYLLSGKNTEGWDISELSIFIGAVIGHAPLSDAYGASFPQLIRYDYRKDLPVISTNEKDIPNLGVQVYPNPATDQITIRYSMLDPSPVNLLVYNINQQLVYTEFYPSSVGVNYHRIQTGNWQSGIYMMQIQSGSGNQWVPFVVIR